MEGIAEWTFEGRSEPEADQSVGREVGTDGNRNRYLAAYMLVYEGVGANQFEWYRGLSEFVSNTE